MRDIQEAAEARREFADRAKRGNAQSNRNEWNPNRVEAAG